jgi:hypothetical protein
VFFEAVVIAERIREGSILPWRVQASFVRFVSGCGNFVIESFSTTVPRWSVESYYIV